MIGDLTLTLGGETVTLRPTFAALLALEKDSGTGLITLARRFAEGTFTVADCVAVLRAGMQGAGETPPPDLGDRLVAAGVAALAGPLVRFLQAALTGDSGAVHDAGKV